MRPIIYILVLFLTSGIWFTSCRSIKYVPVDTVRTEYRTRDSIRFDSIYQRDSVLLFMKGDTVYKERYKYLYRYLTINKVDTVIKADSIQVPYPIEKRLTHWQTIKMELGGWAIGVILLSVLVIVARLIYRLRKK